MTIAFSNRLSWSAADNPLSEALAKRRSQGLPVIDLTVSNPTAVGLPAPAAEWATAAASPAGMRYQPEPRGLSAAREAIAAYYADRGYPVSAADLCLASSTSEAYAHLFRLFADPGHDFLVARPSYPLFDYLAGLEGVRLKPYDLYFDGSWHVDVDTVAAAIGPGTRGIVVVSPNNPTGSYLKQGEWRRLAALAAKRGLPVIVDEVFGDFALAPEADSLLSLAAEEEAPVVVLSGLSKICGLPQVKIGWALAAGPPAFRRDLLHRLELIADTFLSVAQPMQAAVPAWLGGRQAFQTACRTRLAGNLAALKEALQGTAGGVLPVEGGWYAVIRLPAIRTDEQWAGQLLDLGVYCHPGYLFDFPAEACLVASLLPDPFLFRQAMPALHRLGDSID